MNEHEQNISRRDFLKTAWSVVGVAALGESLFVGLRFLAPRQSEDAFGSSIAAGLVDDFPSGSVTPFNQERFFLVRGEDGGFLALYRQCPHLGCTVSHDPQGGEFRCACHASAFRLDGEVLNPPATRPLDLFPLAIEDGVVTVNTAKTIHRTQAEASHVVYAD